MNTAVKLATASVAFAVMTALFATSAEACGVPGLGRVGVGATALTTAVTVTQAWVTFIWSRKPAAAHAPIVGMWKFTYTAEGNGVGGPPEGTPIVDAGYQTWHSDGTELMNSGRAPATGSFCQGVWAQGSASSYRLNHWALSWDFDPTTQQPTVFVGPTNIKENISLAGYGNTFSGTFSITQYAADGVTVLGGLEGAVTATRITAN